MIDEKLTSADETMIKKPTGNKRSIKINNTVEVYFYPPEQSSDSEEEGASLKDDEWERHNKTSIDSCTDEVPFEELFSLYLRENNYQTAKPAKPK